MPTESGRGVEYGNDGEEKLKEEVKEVMSGAWD